jgi:hypothetical protein
MAGIAACEREAAIAPAPAATVALPPTADEPEVDPAPLVLTSSYCLDLDIVAENPVSTRPIHSRAISASLVDRIYFALRNLGRRRPRPSGPRPPRAIRIAWGKSHSGVLSA